MSKEDRERPLQIGKVRQKAQRCLRKGSYRVCDPHLAKQVMPVREIVVNDLFNVVMSEDARIQREWNEEYGEWRYEFSTERFRVFVAFENPNRLVFITAIRLPGLKKRSSNIWGNFQIRSWYGNTFLPWTGKN